MPVNLTVQSGQWEKVGFDYGSIIAKVLNYLALEDNKEAAIVLVDDENIRVFNHDFRGKDKPTNVLSFQSDTAGEWGDIILSYDTIAKEAKEQNKLFEQHLTHLVVHGMLHLLGFDHEDEEDAQEMESVEIAILAKLGIDNPYEKA